MSSETFSCLDSYLIARQAIAAEFSSLSLHAGNLFALSSQTLHYRGIATVDLLIPNPTIPSLATLTQASPLQIALQLFVPKAPRLTNSNMPAVLRISPHVDVVTAVVVPEERVPVFVDCEWLR